MTEKPGEPRDPTDMSHPNYDSAEDPTHPFYESNMTEDGRKPDPADGYKVGPGHPPKQYTWKKGGPSPHPKGRPRKVLSMKPDLKKALEAALNEKVEITKDKKQITLTKASLGIERLVNQFAKGDRHARRDLFQYAAQLGVDLHARDLIAEALGINDQAIVDAAFQRRQQQPSPEPAPDDHVKAPPDLVDDDVAKSEPSAIPAVSPQSDTPKKVVHDQKLDKNGQPMPHDRESIRAMQERHLAQLKKDQGGS